MLQFVLELLQAILGESKKEPDALIGVVFGIANFVCFECGQIVLLRGRRCARGARGGQKDGTQEEKPNFGFHGCFSGGGVAGGFSAGGGASCFSSGRRGKSIFNNSSSMPTKSWRTI